MANLPWPGISVGGRAISPPAALAASTGLYFHDLERSGAAGCRESWKNLPDSVPSWTGLAQRIPLPDPERRQR